ncbi:DUF885 domain-containing protein [Sphingosinicella rhizophila]|uniref:DUF885 domain-containing protein n=1 Tax=Sphingosinicella rhizophila TaxID=3050082 RepID=A0ABU3QA11_9SPHN|nr:DUF885 domain-containing protein [Sphingosinicella sp. GR2756]MDT9600211.1 DUF885 domain-containing protein [Sphingosinicella sp. GR2756]
MMVVAHFRLIAIAALFALGAGLAEGPATAGAGASGAEASQAKDGVKAIADDLLAHLRATEPYVRLSQGLPVTRLDDLSPGAAKRESEFATRQLARLSKIDLADLPHDQWILAGTLRHHFESRVHAQEDYWLSFAVTPYNGGFALSGARQILQGQPLDSPSQRENYLNLLNEYARMIEEMTSKTRAQAARGIRVPRPAIDGIKASYIGLRDAASQMLRVAPGRLDKVDAKQRADFEAAVAGRIEKRIVPALDNVIGVFDDLYVSQAPTDVGLGQYQGGLESYRRRITYNTGLQLTPQQVHDRGLAALADIDAKLEAIRAKVGFKGDRQAFEAQLRKDPRFFAKTPEDLEGRYLAYIGRIEPTVPQYFSTLPKAGYGVKRLDAAGEAGMTFGYYQDPNPSEPRGFYRYNASELDKRSLIMAPHLIYHELIPGHHFQVALAAEDKSLHPVREFLFNAAFNEGWAEYSAHLAGEMGGYPDPYEEYGHLLTQSFMATRLVVDTGLNALGWSLDKARQYMRAHGAESDALAATETLRYSTDLYGQALGYRLGYEQFRTLRKRAEAELGNRFDIRAFHAAAVGNGAMPLNVLQGHLSWFIAQQKRANVSQ